MADSTTDSYKFYYFDFKGRGEVCRLVLAQAGVEYDNVQIKREEWLEYKPKMPLGYIPVLEVNGEMISSCCGICRFLGERFGMDGETDVERAQIWATVDCIHDLSEDMIKVFFEKDEERKKEAEQKLTEKVATKFAIFEKLAADNGAPEGWLYSKLTYADLVLYIALERLGDKASKVLEKFPTLSKNKASVEALPRIAKWLKDRPQTAI